MILKVSYLHIPLMAIFLVLGLRKATIIGRHLGSGLLMSFYLIIMPFPAIIASSS